MIFDDGSRSENRRIIEVGDLVWDVNDNTNLKELCLVVKLTDKVFYKESEDELDTVTLEFNIITVSIETLNEVTQYTDLDEVNRFCELVEKSDNLKIMRR